MPRPTKVNEERLLKDLRAGMNNYQVARIHGVSGEAIRQRRFQFEKKGLLEPRVFTPRGRTGKVRVIKPQPTDNVRQVVREELTRLLQGLLNIDNLTRERDAYKQQAIIAQKTLSKITQSQKEYEVLIQQGQINPPLTSKRTAEFTYHIDCASELIVPDTRPLLNISLGVFVFN